MPPAPTLPQLQGLYNATITAASRFASYNYRHHFLRRTDEVYKPIFAAMNPDPGTVPVPTPNPTDLAKFYAEQTAELEVLKRAAEVNRMYQGPKLVVEHAHPITSGGGAGMEASSGGGGQPV